MVYHNAVDEWMRREQVHLVPHPVSINVSSKHDLFHLPEVLKDEGSSIGCSCPWLADSLLNWAWWKAINTLNTKDISGELPTDKTIHC